MYLFITLSLLLFALYRIFIALLLPFYSLSHSQSSFCRPLSTLRYQIDSHRVTLSLPSIAPSHSFITLCHRFISFLLPSVSTPLMAPCRSLPLILLLRMPLQHPSDESPTRKSLQFRGEFWSMWASRWLRMYQGNSHHRSDWILVPQAWPSTW